MIMTLEQTIKGEHHDEIVAIITKPGARMNWRRDLLRFFFQENNINCTFSVSEMKTEIERLYDKESNENT